MIALGKLWLWLSSLCPGERRNAMSLRDYLTIKEAAVFLGVSPNTLRNWERAGRLATHRHPFNRYRLYKKADLQALLTRIEQSATKEQHATS